MKKIISLMMALTLVLSLATSVFAESEVGITVDGRTITFREDVAPTIINDRTYVPVRRVLEAMGAKVSWVAETRTVKVSSADNTVKLDLTIDSKEISVLTFTSILNSEQSTIISDVAPIILNDRTMLPIRVVAEAIGAKVEYDDEAKLVNITTKYAKRVAEVKYDADTTSGDFKVEETVSEDLPKLSISSDTKDIKQGDTVTLKVKVSDLEKLHKDAKISGLTFCLFYDPENFDFDGFTLISKEGETSPTLSASNPTFYDNGLKFVYVNTYDASYEPAKDGTIVEIKFTAKSENGGSFKISNGISEIGYDCELLLLENDDVSSLSKYTELFVDTTPVFVK